MNNYMKKNVTLVLSGGGARGFAHIGAIEEIERRGYSITSIAGTSMGALVGGVYATGKMDEFKDIDAEIMRLKEELSVRDENLKQVKFPASGDYWRSRLDEERMLWEKRNALAREERITLEKKLTESH